MNSPQKNRCFTNKFGRIIILIYNKNSTCCFTGHRDIPPKYHGKISSVISVQAERLYSDYSVCNFITGGAVGFDMIAAETVAGMKYFFRDIRLILALPCENHYAKWSETEKQKFFRIAESADETVYISRDYEKGCMLARDRFMVDNSGYCISYCVRQSGGTFYTLSYARKKGLFLTEISGLVQTSANRAGSKGQEDK